MRFRPAIIGWSAIAAWVAVYDPWAIRNGHRTLSEAFGDALRHPIKKWPVLAIWGYLTLHLFGILLPKPIRTALTPLDPLARIAELVPQKNG